MNGQTGTSVNVAATFRSPETLCPGIWRRKSNRLDAESYLGPNVYLVTTATAGRAPRFTAGNLVESCLTDLSAVKRSEQMEVLAYVFMPDHLHLLLLGSERSSLARFMKRFKQETGFAFKQRTGEMLWQKGYHDHVLRKEEDLADVAKYIAANPVRAGLVAGWTEYLYMGGLLLDGARDGDLKVAATLAGINAGVSPE